MSRPPRSGTGDGAEGVAPAPAEVTDYAAQAVEYVRRALGVTLEYDSDTLPVLDHYLRSVPRDSAAASHLVAAAAGAYFGEVVRRTLGGDWTIASADPGDWRLVLPGGLSFSPAAMALAAIQRPDLEPEAAEEVTDPDADALASDWDASIQAPPPLRAAVAQVLEGMADVSAEEFYTLCCRLDTLEHVQAVLTGIASARRETPS